MQARKTSKTSLTKMLKSKYSERTVARDLAINLVTALSFSLFLVAIVSFLYQTRSDDKELRERVAESSNNLSELLAFPMWTYNEVEIKSLVGRYALAEDITGILVVDDVGKPVIDFKKSKKSRDIHAKKEIVYKGRKVGKIKVSGSTSPFYQRALGNLALIGFITLFAIFLIVLLILPLLNKYLDEPLNRLVVGIQRIASGQYRETLPSVPQKELARITDEVNFMAEKISLREHQIRESMQAATVLKTEIGMAETLQRSMTATRGFQTARRVAQYYQPMTNLSGDWMTVFECDKGRTIYAMVGDVTGHGIPQGLVTMAAFGAIQTLRPLIQQNSKSFTPAAILNILRSTLVTVLNECELAMTVSVIKIDVQSRKVTMSSAGHPLPLVVRPHNGFMRVIPLAAKAQSPLGFELLTRAMVASPYVDTDHNLESEDTICLFSDGLTEARGPSAKQFQPNFLSLLRNLDRRYPPTVLLDRVLQKLQGHLKDQSVTDDICLMIIDTRKDEQDEAAA